MLLLSLRSVLQVRMINDRLIQLERAFIIEELSSSSVASRRYAYLTSFMQQLQRKNLTLFREDPCSSADQ